MGRVDTVTAARARRAIDVLSGEAVVRAAYIFGSQAEGTADEWSDIDLAAFVEGVESWDIERRALAAVRMQKIAGDDMELHLFPAASLSNPEPASFVAYILRCGARVELSS
ncbi:MAG: nucleotidyltransferase domain-containing protein [Deltaproteobacteria bacterium]|nr:nucleotidyltransferase domain-containing protein [Deltaproteobacteria bacterium]